MTTNEDLSVLAQVGQEPDYILQYGNSRDQCCDIYSGASNKRPLLILLHGGFWRPNRDRLHLRTFASALAADGWQVALVEYRRIPGSPDATIDDVEIALTTLPRQVSDHNGNVVLLGHSAGGQLALWAASNKKIANVAGVISLAPVADLIAAEESNLGEGAVSAFLGVLAARRPDLDPMQMARPGVSTIILHGDADQRVPIQMSRNYATSATSKRAMIKLIELANIGHFELIDPLSSAWPILKLELSRF